MNQLQSDLYLLIQQVIYLQEQGEDLSEVLSLLTAAQEKLGEYK